MVLAGSAEAREIAQTCAQRGAQVRALVSEPPRGANPMPVPCALLDFADPAAVDTALAGCDAVVDASHGFDAALSMQGIAAARRAGLPVVSYVRPLWPVDATLNMTAARDVAAAMRLVKAKERVFSAAGWASLRDCATFPGETLFLRQTSPHDRAPPFPFVMLSFGTPPFDVASEVALFKSLGIHRLLCRNLGGRASWPKVAAALELGLAVTLIDRPAMPAGGATVSSTQAAIDWVAAQ